MLKALKGSLIIRGFIGILLLTVAAAIGPRVANSDEVVLRPAYITGTIGMGSETPTSASVSASWSSYSASTNTSTGSYSLTVNVPEGSTPTYSVSASAYFDNYRDSVSFGSQSVPVTAFGTSTANFGTATPGYIQGTVTVNGGTLGYAYIYAYQSSPTNYTYSNTYTYPSTTGLCGGQTGAGGSFCVPVMPNTNIQVYGSAYVGNQYYSLSNQYFSVGAGQTVTANWTVTHVPPPPPQTGTIAGTISSNGTESASRLDVRAYSGSSSATQYFYDTNSGAYSLANLNAGTASMNAYAYFNNYRTYFQYPYGSFSPTRNPTVTAGATTTVNISADQAFILGNFSIGGTKTLSEAQYLYLNSYGASNTAAYGGSAQEQVNLQTGAYELVLSAGSWQPYRWQTRWYNTNPAAYLNSNLSVNDYATIYTPVALTGGQTVTRNLSYATGTVTVNFTVLGGGTLSSPYLSGSCQKRNEANQYVWTYSFNASSNQSNVAEGSVTFVGLEGTCNVTARAYVGGSWTTFGQITVDVVAGAQQVIDIGGPTLTVTFPQPGYITPNASIIVTGRATDDVEVASVTVNGVSAVLTSTNNPADPQEVSFTATVPLVKGPNQIVTVATDTAAKTATDTRTVYSDESPPHLTWTPADGTVTSSFAVTVQGIASNDAGVAKVTVNGVQVTITPTGNPNDFTEVSFSTPVTLVSGPNDIVVTATDISNRTISQTHRVTVSENEPPVAADDSAATTEDTAVTIRVLANDSDPDGDPLSVSSVSPAAHGSVVINPDYSVTYTPNAGFNGTDNFSYIVEDGEGGVDTGMVTVTVVNTPPTVQTDTEHHNIPEGSAHVHPFTFTDPDRYDTHTATVNWNDPSQVEGVTLTDHSGSPSHTFRDNGDFALDIKVCDNDGACGTAQAMMHVINVPPTVGSITAPLDPVRVGTAVSTNASFTDPGVLDTHTAVWEWGDGASSAGVVTEANGSGSVTGSHTYTRPEIYTVRLTVTDKDGGLGQSVFQYIVVFDPEGGFVTGGGWINSPAGAYTADQTLTGRANFGFVSKYQRGATVPTGVTEFQFKVANLNFHSDAYEWLVVAGARAQYKGIGTINGTGNYGFMLSAIDGNVNGGGGADKFRIKIWNRDSGDGVVYDNQMGLTDDKEPTTVLGGGSITIHTRG